MHHVKWFAILLLIVVSAPALRAQQTVRGTVSDSETAEPLPSCHVRVIGTYQGAITNNDGQFIIEVRDTPAEIRISRIGYRSGQVTVTGADSLDIAIELVPEPVVLEPVEVSPEDPAVNIMREVIRRKQQWRPSVRTFNAKAYTRSSLSNEERIAMISESISELSWHHENGMSEEIISKRQTKNIDLKMNFASARMIQNMYDDDIEMVGFDIVGPTHPDAFRYYDFRLAGHRMMDGNVVYDIDIIPKSRFQPLVTGRLAVLDREFAMIEVDVRPNKAVMFPPPLKEFSFHLTQRFSNFDGDTWFPVDVSIDGEIKIKLPGLSFPAIKYRQLTRLTDYDVNIEITNQPDKPARKHVAVSISSEEMTVDTWEGDQNTPPEKGPDAGNPGDDAQEEEDVAAAAAADSIFAASPLVIPFSADEKVAYADIDSTDTIEEAFKPTGFLMKFLDRKSGKKTDEPPGRAERMKKTVLDALGPFSPQFVHNRVDGLSPGMKFKRGFLDKRLDIELRGLYHDERDDWTRQVKAAWTFGESRRFNLNGEYFMGTDTRFRSHYYPVLFNSMTMLMGGEDMYDYYLNEKYRFGAGYRIKPWNTRFNIGLNLERHDSLPKTTEYALMDRRDPVDQRDNPVASEGRLHSIDMSVELGQEEMVWGLVGQKRAFLSLEYADDSLLGGDMSFAKFHGEVDWRFETYLKRRLLPWVLDLRLVAGTSSGDLPVQRFGILEGTLGRLGPFGVFRAQNGQPLEGEKYVACYWEHNFRTFPFELMHFDWMVKKGTGIIVHGASGRTWMDSSYLVDPAFTPRYCDEYHHEVGLSLNALFGYFRVDVTKRMNDGITYGGVGFARMF